MIRRFVLIIFAFVMAVVIFQPAVPVQAAEELKEYLFRGMTDYSLEDQSRNFERLTIKIMNPENEEFEDKTFEGNRVYSYYNYAGNDEKRPSDFQLMRYNQSALQKLGGEILWESGNEFHASFTRNNKQFYMKVFSNNGYHYEVYILELAELDYDVEILNDDTIVRGMTDYELEEQTRKFERLTIYFNNTENEDVEEKTYVGNLVYLFFNYTGNNVYRPSDLQILRYFQSAVKKLGGEILWESGSELHASFTRNGGQRYMKVLANNGYHYGVYILEPEKLDYDVELLDDGENTGKEENVNDPEILDDDGIADNKKTDVNTDVNSDVNSEMSDTAKNVM